MNSITAIPHETLPALQMDRLQPITDVAAYFKARKNRRPEPFHMAEQALFITLPAEVQAEVIGLESAVQYVLNLITEGLNVSRACRQALSLFPRWELKTFRAKYDAWDAAKDWIVLVNRSKASLAWKDADQVGLADCFLTFCAMRIGQFKGRTDSQRQALASIRRQWRTGLNPHGKEEIIPGYEATWPARNPDVIPDGWSDTNIGRQLKARAKLSKATKALLHHGIATARAFLPQVHSTREGLRFLELVQFDDIKLDWRVFDPATGQVMDLWLLIAHDVATTLLLGFGMRPARVREDGSQEHLKLRDTKQLFGWMLERYGLPPYQMIGKFENATATLSEGSAAAIEEMLPDRIRISWGSMIGGKSPLGYAERAVGNSKAKASLESCNRLFHTIGAFTDGQTGPLYNVRPADLAARERECRDIWDAVPEHLRYQAQYPLLTLAQARLRVVEICRIRNSRTDHAIEGFERIVVDEGGKLRQRLESPTERAARLMAPFVGEWTHVSPEIIAAFYAHTQRTRPVEDNGEIKFQHEDKVLRFQPPTPELTLTPGTKVLCYFHPDDPRYLHLTTGKGAVLGTWLRTSLVKYGDEYGLADAIRRSASALAAAKARAAELSAEERQRLDAMRAHNAELMGEFIDVDKPATVGMSTASSPVAHALTAVGEIRAEEKAKEKRQAEDAARDILATHEREERGETSAGDDLLRVIAGRE
jgi:hypothetical protein